MYGWPTTPHGLGSIPAADKNNLVLRPLSPRKAVGNQRAVAMPSIPFLLSYSKPSLH